MGCRIPGYKSGGMREEGNTDEGFQRWSWGFVREAVWIIMDRLELGDEEGVHLYKRANGRTGETQE
jgi:hypothetical protein